MGDESQRQIAVKGLVFHVLVFLAVNLFLVAVWALAAPNASLGDVPCALVHPNEARAMGFFPMYVLLIWGAGLLVHTGVVASMAPRRWRQRRHRALRDQLRDVRTVSGIRAGEESPSEMSRADASVTNLVMTDHRDAPPGKAPNGNHKTTVERATRGTDERVPASTGGTAFDVSPPRQAGRRRADAPVTAVARFGRRATDRTGARHWVAVLFTDIVGSTPLNERYGDETWSALLVEHRALVREGIGAHRGVEVGTQGDGFLIRFEGPDDAASFAVFLQHHLSEHRKTQGSDRQLHIRIGIHAGEVVQNDDDLVGRVINLASRVTSAAEADEILVTEPFADHLSGDHPLVDRGLVNLKGFDRPRHVLALDWETSEQLDRTSEQKRPDQATDRASDGR